MAYNFDATLVAGNVDYNATLVGGGDDNATLVGGNSGPAPQYQAPARAQAYQGQGQVTIVPHIRMLPQYEYFQVVDIDVPRTVKFGRVTEPPTEEPDFVGFNSKVVSRRHAEIWSVNNEFYIRDTKSQSGTFLNAMRLSLPGEESKPFKLKNGDAIQFGVDRRGTNTDDMKCVAMTIELSFRKVVSGSQGQLGPRQPIQNTPAPAYIPPLNGVNHGYSDLTLVMNQGQRQ